MECPREFIQFITTGGIMGNTPGDSAPRTHFLRISEIRSVSGRKTWRIGAVDGTIPGDC